MMRLTVGYVMLMLLAACGHFRIAENNPLHAGSYSAIKSGDDSCGLFQKGDHRVAAEKLIKPSCPDTTDSVWIRFELLALPKGALNTFSPELQSEIASGNPVSQWVLDRLFTDARARSVATPYLMANNGGIGGFEMISSLTQFETNPAFQVDEMIAMDVFPTKQADGSLKLNISSTVSSRRLSVIKHVPYIRFVHPTDGKYEVLQLAHNSGPWEVFAFMQVMKN